MGITKCLPTYWLQKFHSWMSADLSLCRAKSLHFLCSTFSSYFHSVCYCSMWSYIILTLCIKSKSDYVVKCLGISGSSLTSIPFPFQVSTSYHPNSTSVSCTAKKIQVGTGQLAFASTSYLHHQPLSDWAVNPSGLLYHLQ